MQKTGARILHRTRKLLPASDLERYTEPKTRVCTRDRRLALFGNLPV